MSINLVQQGLAQEFPIVEIVVVSATTRRTLQKMSVFIQLVENVERDIVRVLIENLTINGITVSAQGITESI